MHTSIPSLLCLRRLAAVVFAGAVAVGVCSAATLPFDAPMHTHPDDDAPVVGTLSAGVSITSMLREDLTTAGLDSPPPGWIVLQHPGPFAGFVLNREVQDDGTIKPGAQIRGQPLADAPLLLVVEAGDVATAREPLGDWSRAIIQTDLIVYVNALPTVSRSQPAVTEPATAPEPAPASSAMAAASDEIVIETPAPVSTEKPATSKPPREAKVKPTPVESTGAPRTFVGYLMPTRRFLGRGPKYDYQLVDENGKRIALLDLSSLLATSPLDTFENRRVSVYGPGITRPDVEDLILRVQTLRLER